MTLLLCTLPVELETGGPCPVFPLCWPGGNRPLPPSGQPAMVLQMVHIYTLIVEHIPAGRVRHTEVIYLSCPCHQSSMRRTEHRSFGCLSSAMRGRNIIRVVTTPVTACVTGCNRTTTAEQVHMHKKKSQKTTPQKHHWGIFRQRHQLQSEEAASGYLIPQELLGNRRRWHESRRYTKVQEWRL